MVWQSSRFRSDESIFCDDDECCPPIFMMSTRDNVSAFYSNLFKLFLICSASGVGSIASWYPTCCTARRPPLRPGGQGHWTISPFYSKEARCKISSYRDEFVSSEQLYFIFLMVPIVNLLLKAAIRAHTLKIMCRSSNKDTFPLHASATEVSEWDSTSTSECCDKDLFLVNFEGMPKSDWNRSCGRVFEQSFRSSLDHKDWLDSHDIRNAWFTHLRHLIKTYKRSLASESKDEV